MNFAEASSPTTEANRLARVKFIEAELEARKPARIEALGYVVQPADKL